MNGARGIRRPIDVQLKRFYLELPAVRMDIVPNISLSLSLSLSLSTAGTYKSCARGGVTHPVMEIVPNGIMALRAQLKGIYRS